MTKLEAEALHRRTWSPLAAGTRLARQMRAFNAWSANLPVHAQRQCSRCGSQWRSTRYGWELSPHTLFGCAQFVCPDCSRRG